MGAALFADQRSWCVWLKSSSDAGRTELNLMQAGQSQAQINGSWFDPMSSPMCHLLVAHESVRGRSSHRQQLSLPCCLALRALLQVFR
jgi:hypothetical protein